MLKGCWWVSWELGSSAATEAANRNAIATVQATVKISTTTDKTSQLYATKLGQYDYGMKAADRAAARAYAVEQFNQTQRLKQANVSNNLPFSC